MLPGAGKDSQGLGGIIFDHACFCSDRAHVNMLLTGSKR